MKKIHRHTWNFCTILSELRISFNIFSIFLFHVCRSICQFVSSSNISKNFFVATTSKISVDSIQSTSCIIYSDKRKSWINTFLNWNKIYIWSFSWFIVCYIHVTMMLCYLYLPYWCKKGKYYCFEKRMRPKNKKIN